MTNPVDEGAVAAVAEVLAVHRWKSMGVSSVECECGELCYGDESLTQFPADEAFRRHLATETIAALTNLFAAAEQRGREAAWDEGYAAGADHWGIIDPPWDEPTNPYRDRTEEASDGGR